MSEPALELGGRGGTIGGTSWGPILGVDKWRGPHDIWMRIKGLEERTPPNKAMLRGTRLEPIVSALAADALALELTEPKVVTVRWPKPYGNFSASVDREASWGGRFLGPVELKTMSDRATWGGGPASYRLQLQSYIWHHHLIAQQSGGSCNWGALVCLQASSELFDMIQAPEDAERLVKHGAARLHVNIVCRDEAFMTEVVPYVQEWWRRYVDGDTPPPSDGSEGCTKALRALYSDREGSIDATDEIEELARKREEVRARAKEAEREQRALDNRLRELLGPSACAEGRGVKVSVSTRQGRARFDSSLFKSENPDLFKRYQTVGSPYDVLSVKVRD